VSPLDVAELIRGGGELALAIVAALVWFELRTIRKDGLRDLNYLASRERMRHKLEDVRAVARELADTRSGTVAHPPLSQPSLSVEDVEE
jgi:hypothetical protein